jgi:hypothetical protein
MDLGKEYWKDYGVLDQKFRQSLGVDPGDLAIGREHLKRGLRVNILAFCNNEPAGFIRLDLRSQPHKIGDLYTEPKFRGREVVLENTPWLKSEEGYRVWQYLDKAVWVIGRRAGYGEIGSYVHAEAGQKASDWRKIQMPKWEKEVGEMDEPRQLLELIRGKPELVRR